MLSRANELFQSALKVMPGGVSRNTLLVDGQVRYASHGSGCHLWDINGKQYLDFSNNMASLIHGHAFGPIVNSVSRQLKLGTAFTMATEVEIQFAEHMVNRSSSFDQIRFINSGTEAVMAGIKAARAYTGRPKIAKVEGSYHGSYDYAEVSQMSRPGNWGAPDRPAAVPLAAGTPPGLVADTIVLPFNDAANAIAILDEYRTSIAGVLVDPVPHRIGMSPISSEYAQALKAWTTKNEALLIFDEVITYRSEVGGMQEQLNVCPDLTAMGKMIGGGFPVGAIAGREDVMAVFQNGVDGLRLPLAGTFSANPITMTAGLVAMTHFDQSSVARINVLGDRVRAGLADAINAAGVRATVTGSGSLFRIHLKENAPRNYREAYLSATEQGVMNCLINELYALGIILIHTGSGVLSTAMDEPEIEQFVSAMYAALCTLRPALEELQ